MMTLASSALKTLKPLVKAFDVKTYRAPTMAELRAAHIAAAKAEENFMVYNGTGFHPSVKKMDRSPLVLNAGRGELLSFAIRPAAYLRYSLKPGDRVVFSENNDRLYMIYDHRFFLDTLQPTPLLRAILLADHTYRGGFGRKGLYKYEWGSELLVPAPVPPQAPPSRRSW
ncbi:MAG: hypothetical protein PSY14_11725 [bacterium]|nr:hypothetical protein [bacterium]